MYIFNENKFKLKVNMMCDGGGDGGGGDGVSGPTGSDADFGGISGDIGVPGGDADAGPGLALAGQDSATADALAGFAADFGGFTDAGISPDNAFALAADPGLAADVLGSSSAFADFATGVDTSGLGLSTSSTNVGFSFSDAARAGSIGATIGGLPGAALGFIGGGLIGGSTTEPGTLGGEFGLPGYGGGPQGPGGNASPDFGGPADQPNTPEPEKAPKPKPTPPAQVPPTEPIINPLDPEDEINERLRRLRRQRAGFLSMRRANDLGPLYIITPGLFG